MSVGSTRFSGGLKEAFKGDEIYNQFENEFNEATDDVDADDTSGYIGTPNAIEEYKRDNQSLFSDKGFTRDEESIRSDITSIKSDKQLKDYIKNLLNKLNKLFQKDWQGTWPGADECHDYLNKIYQDPDLTKVFDKMVGSLFYSALAVEYYNRPAQSPPSGSGSAPTSSMPSGVTFRRTSNRSPAEDELIISPERSPEDEEADASPSLSMRLYGREGGPNPGQVEVPVIPLGDPRAKNEHGWPHQNVALPHELGKIHAEAQSTSMAEVLYRSAGVSPQIAVLLALMATIQQNSEEQQFTLAILQMRSQMSDQLLTLFNNISKATQKLAEAQKEATDNKKDATNVEIELPTSDFPQYTGADLYSLDMEGQLRGSKLSDSDTVKMNAASLSAQSTLASQISQNLQNLTSQASNKYQGQFSAQNTLFQMCSSVLANIFQNNSKLIANL